MKNKQQKRKIACSQRFGPETGGVDVHISGAALTGWFDSRLLFSFFHSKTVQTQNDGLISFQIWKLQLILTVAALSHLSWPVDFYSDRNDQNSSVNTHFWGGRWLLLRGGSEGQKPRKLDVFKKGITQTRLEYTVRRTLIRHMMNFWEYLKGYTIFKNCPVKKYDKKGHFRDNQWMTEGLQNACGKKNSLYKRFIKSR